MIILESSNLFNLRGRILLASTLITTGLIALTSCARYELFVPEYHAFNTPPEEVTIAQLLSDYLENAVTADTKYKGERLLFYEVEVEQVDSHLFYRNDNWIFEKNYFTSGSVKFRLCGEDYAIMQSIEEGYVLNIVGECQGIISGGYSEEPLILIDNCWVESVIGDLGGEWEPPMY